MAIQRTQSSCESRIGEDSCLDYFFRLRLQAIAWCPWENSKVLATGGGHSDGYLRFWNNSNGTCQRAIKTDSQVPCRMRDDETK